MRILIVTRSAWDDSNSLGNTMSNLFSGFSSNNIANFYVRSAQPNNEVCTKYFSMSDKDVFKSIFDRRHVPGNYFSTVPRENTTSIKTTNENVQEEKLYRHFRNRSSILALCIQNLMWKISKWKSPNLNEFLDDFEPDIIFSPSFHTFYTHRILWYLKEKTDAKLVLFHTDDYLNYSSEVSFLEKIYKEKRVKVIIKSAEIADLNYCISNKQKKEYEDRLKKDIKLLYKGADFSEQPKYEIVDDNSVIQITYIGSLLHGRWKTLSLLAKIISEINNEEKKIELIIYSQYSPSEEMLQYIEINGASKFMGEIPSDQVQCRYSESDIVLHTESFDDVEKRKTRLSFSTKIVDCLCSGRTIMAIGWEKAASIEYLKENDAALIANSETDIEKILKRILDNPSILKVYSEKSWKCGKKNHKIDTIQKKFYDDLKNL